MSRSGLGDCHVARKPKTPAKHTPRMRQNISTNQERLRRCRAIVSVVSPQRKPYLGLGRDLSAEPRHRIAICQFLSNLTYNFLQTRPLYFKGLVAFCRQAICQILISGDLLVSARGHGVRGRYERNHDAKVINRASRVCARSRRRRECKHSR